jgi:hypothetical protein
MDAFFQSNPGMSSRVAHHIDFPDYTVDELCAIADLLLDQQDFELSAEARPVLREYLERRKTQPRFANGRSVRNALERARLRQARRLVAAGRPVRRADLMRIESEDLLASRVMQDDPPTESNSREG